ncbi:MAG: hypothetical protein ACU0CB_06850 [Roseovarius sp.]|jgi:hypothetical protein|uniref:hypothetical protein n=1 Tax=Roseovarius sp. TaxID=1486281 RepID=UPI00261FC4FD|nr:hypothetical protein [Roseovarius sp.]
MTTPPTELENSIQLALEAATAANDSAEDVARVSTETLAAAARLDKFAKGMKPLLFGVVASAVLCVALAGLVYLRTLSDMRTATATQIEALTVFSKSVGDLQAQLEALGDMSEKVAAIEAAQTAGIERLEETMMAETARLAEAMSATEDPAAPQMLRGLVDRVEASHVETRDAFAKGLSDLQLAMTKMLAERAEVLAKAAPQTAAAAPKPVAKAPSRKKPQARVEPNPFGFP